MTKIRCIPAADLSFDDIARWSDFQSRDPSLDSPYFRPEFTLAVSRVRTDVEVAVIEQAGEPVGYFPYQRGRLNIGRPVGGKLSDYHGIIGRADVITDAAELVRACGLSSLDFDHLLARQSAFAKYHRGEIRPSRWMDLSQGYNAYVAGRKAAGTEIIKKTQQQLRRLEREHGPIRFEAASQSEAAFEQVIRWKSEQYARTGMTDVFAFPWTTELLKRLLASETTDFGGELAAIWCGDTLLAAMISLRSRHVLHSWFPAYNPDFATYTAGIILFLKLAEDCLARGITRIDLGKGDERYKLQLSTPGTLLAEGTIEGSGPAVWLRKSWRRTKSLLESSNLGPVGRAPLKLLEPIRGWLAFADRT